MTTPNPQQPRPQPDKHPATPPARPRRRRWPWVLMGAALLLLVLVALLPAIGSSGPVRKWVLGRINAELDGRIEIDRWSIGWFSGAQAQGVRLYAPADASDQPAIEITRLTTELSVSRLLSGSLDAGRSVVDVRLPNLSLDRSGQPNLPQPRPAAKPSPAAQPGPLPDIRGHFTINILGGTIHGLVLPEAVTVEPGSIVAELTGINQPGSFDLQLGYRIGHGKPSRIRSSGSIDAFENGVFQLEQLAVNLSLMLEDVDLAGIWPIVNVIVPGQAPQLSGLLNGTVEIDAPSLAQSSAQGRLVVEHFRAAGGPLAEGDEFATQRIEVPIRITRQETDGLSFFQIEDLAILMPEGQVGIRGRIPQHALLNALAGLPPGGDGEIRIETVVPDLTVLNQFRNTLAIEDDVTVSGGELKHLTLLTVARQSVTARSQIDLTALGQRAGQTIKIEPIHLAAQVAAAFSPEGTTPALRDLSLSMTSGFATMRGAAGSLDELQLTGDFDLARLQSQLAQFVQLGDLDLAGRGSFELAAGGPISLELLGLRATGLLDQPVAIDRVKVSALAEPVMADGALARLALSDVVIVTGPEARPVLDIRAEATLDARQFNVPAFAFSLRIADLPAAQRQLGPLLPLGEMRLDGGDLVIDRATGSLVNGRVKLDSPVQFRSQGLAIRTNPQAEPLTTRLAGTLELSDAAGGYAVATRLQFDDLGAGQRVRNQALELTARATLPADFSSASLNARLSGKIAQLSIADAQLRLAAPDNATVPVWDMLQRAQVTADVPSLAEVHELVRAFQVAAEQPDELPPLQVTGGAAQLRLNVTRDAAKRTTVVSLEQLHIANLAIQRDQNRYQPAQETTLELLATLETDGDAIRAINIQRLGGTLGDIGKLSMPQPLSIADPLGMPTARGAIALEGSIDRAAALLAVLQGGQPLAYDGAFRLEQTLSSRPWQQDGTLVMLAGTIAAQDFRAYTVHDGKRHAAFTEPRLDIANQLELRTTPQQQDVFVRSLSLRMPQSQALDAQFAGRVMDLGNRRLIRGIGDEPQAILRLGYNIERLWPIILPLLSAELQEQLADARASGSHQTTLQVWGSYPVRDTAAESFRELRAQGSLLVPSFDGMGLAVRNLPVAFTLERGVFRTTPAEPGRVNSGTINLAGLNIDLAGDEPRLTAREAQLLENVSINPLLGDRLGRFINPIFPNSQRAEGRLSVRLESAENLALGESLKTPKSGKARITFSITDLDVANPLGSMMLGEATRGFAQALTATQFIRPGGDVRGLIAFSEQQANVFQGRIQNGVITIAEGRTTQEITIDLIEPARPVPDGVEPARPRVLPLSFRGDIALNDLSQTLQVNLPVQLITQFVRGEDFERTLTRAFPRGLPLTLRGTTLSPRVDLGDAITRGFRSAIEAQITDRIQRELQRQITGGRDAPATAPTTAPANSNEPDPLGALLEGLIRERQDRRRPEHSGNKP